MEESENAPGCARRDDLVGMLYGEASEHEASDFKQHMLTCSECDHEFAKFGDVRELLFAWRQQSLSFATKATVAQSHETVEPRKRLAVAALRELFALSPLWMKGAVGFASVLFCLLAFMAIARLREKPRLPLINNYVSDQELDARVEARVQKKLAELKANGNSNSEETTVGISESPRHRNLGVGVKVGPSQLASNPRSTRRPLTKQEREQLAADLRLISTTDEADLDLLGDRLSRQED